MTPTSSELPAQAQQKEKGKGGGLGEGSWSSLSIVYFWNFANLKNEIGEIETSFSHQIGKGMKEVQGDYSPFLEGCF